MSLIVLTLVACSSPDGAPPKGEEPDLAPTGTGSSPDKPTEFEDDEPPCVPAASVAINELSASNESVLLDRQGDSVDWVELYNPGAEPVALGGWTLSDDGEEPSKWEFPALTLEPGGFQLIHTSGKGESATVATWDTRVDQGDTFRYLPVVAAPDPTWFQTGFDDSAWAEGPSGFGAEDGDDATEVTSETLYVRTDVVITAAELADLAALVLHVDYDDAFVAYLNGVEVARAGIGETGVPPDWRAYASSDHEAQIQSALQPTAFDLQGSLGLLGEGANTLALEVHQGSSTSLDLSLIPFLSLGFRTDRPGRTSMVLEGMTAEVHTNFSLSADGERLRLYDTEGCEVDDVEPGQMFTDQSFGRQPDGTGVLGYFMEPTPGAPNVTESRPGFAGTPVFSPAPGHVAEGTDVQITAGQGAEVHVAWDGVEPRETDPVYSAPLDTPVGTEAFVVRARAWEAGLWPSRIATATYLLRAPGSMPIVSLVTDPPNLWDDETGIYTFGAEYEPEPPFDGANFQEDWERPIHMAAWEPDGAMAFAVDAGVAIHGGHSRIYEQKSLLVELESGYGDTTIEHDVFPGLGIQSFSRLLLRAGGNDQFGCYSQGCSVGAHLRDGLMHRLTAGEDLDVLAWRPAEVYLNGEYWGVYHLNERPDQSYVASHHGVEDIDLLEGNARVNEGDGVHYAETMTYLRTHDLSDPANYAHVKTLIDVDELATYLVFEVYYDNGDWPGNNVKYWRPRTGDGRWRWMLYDTDFGLGPWDRPTDNDSLARLLDPAGPSWPNPPWSTELFRLLVQSPEFTDAFLNRYADYLNTLLVPEVASALLHDMEAELAAEMPRQQERWGSWTDGVESYRLEEGSWEGQIRGIDRWFEERPAFARDHVVTNFGLAGTFALTLDADPPGAGSFQLSAVEVGAPFEGVYFQGVPVTITAIPAAGHVFREWSDPDLAADPTVTVAPADALTLVAYFD